jgi:F-type H+-transporting ATPase subunit epsilon
MATESFRLEIISPAGEVFNGDIEHVRAPGVKGSFGVLKGHTPFITALEIGLIEAKVSGNEEKLFATSGGHAEVHGDHVVILAETAEEKSRIDVERAKISRDKALERMDQKEPDLDLERAQLALARAINRIKIATD